MEDESLEKLAVLANATPEQAIAFLRNQIDDLTSKVQQKEEKITSEIQEIWEIREELNNFRVSEEDIDVATCEKSLVEGIRIYEEMKVVLDYLKYTLQIYRDQIEALQESQTDQGTTPNIPHDKMELAQRTPTTIERASEIGTAIATLAAQIKATRLFNYQDVQVTFRACSTELR